MQESALGKNIRQAEIKRQLLSEIKDIPEYTVAYLSSLNFLGELSKAEQEFLDSFVSDEVVNLNQIHKERTSASETWRETWRKTIKDAEITANLTCVRSKFETDTRYISDTNIASSSWLASTVYYGEPGLDYGDYWEDSYTPPIDPAKQSNEQLWAHEDSLRDAESIGEFHGSAVKALDFHKALDNQEEDSLAVRIAYSGLYDDENGPCPSLEEMLGIAKGFQVIASDNVVRPVTHIEVIGYDKYHNDKADVLGTFTVGRHNELVESLGECLTTEQAKKLSEEGAVILWNAGNSGRHYAVNFAKGEL